jgi:(1->4)-alpha-D-glucan 1-alpha-D-glucosylmutase
VDDAFVDRMLDYVRKAAREAKASTSWLDPDAAHEDALFAVVRHALADGGAAFLAPFGELLESLGPAAAAASLGQVLLKIAAPGVPDLYQGTERWDLSVVDPDNRRPVPFDAFERDLVALLEGERDPRALREGWRDGRVKQLVTALALGERAVSPELFRSGAHLPIGARGPWAEHVVSFARHRVEEWAVAIAPRRCLRLQRARMEGVEPWNDTVLVLPHGAPIAWRDVFTGNEVRSDGRALALVPLLGRFPVALLRPTA